MQGNDFFYPNTRLLLSVSWLLRELRLDKRTHRHKPTTRMHTEKLLVNVHHLHKSDTQTMKQHSHTLSLVDPYGGR